MRNLILGGLIALIGSAIVQAVIVPLVTNQRRRRERWEEAMIALQTLVEVDFVAAGKRLSLASAFVSNVRRRLKSITVGGIDRIHLDSLESRYHEDAKAADEKLTELRAESFRLFEHARLYRPRANYWRVLEMSLLRHDFLLMDVTYSRSDVDSITSEEMQKLWDDVAELRKALLARIKEVSDYMRPPRTYPMRRFKRGAQRRLMGAGRGDRSEIKQQTQASQES